MSEIVFPPNINYKTKILNISSKNFKGILNLKKFTQLEELYCVNNQITRIINIPYKLKYLNCSHNQIEILDNLPNEMKGFNVKKNKIAKLHHNVNIRPNKYPRTLKIISLCTYFKKSLDNLPKKLTHLDLGFTFSRELGNLPKKIKKISLSLMFNQPINNLPLYLDTLTMCGGIFNQKINNLPISLTCLFLGMDFNQSINKLPESLLDLKLGFNFNQTLNDLPMSLEYLTLCCQVYNSFSFINNLPNSLKYFKLNGGNGNNIKNNIINNCDKIIYLPPQLNYLELVLRKFITGKNIIKCPNTLKKITISNYNMVKLFDECDKDKITEYEFGNDNLTDLPKTITHLVIKSIKSNNSNNFILKIPSNITKLTFNFHNEIYQISENNN